MPRPELSLGENWESEIFSRAKERLKELLDSEPLSEDEIWIEVVRALGGEKGIAETARRLRRLYNLEYRKKISENTSNLAVVSNLKKITTKLKKDLLKEGYNKTKRVIQFGKNYYGLIYYKNKKDVKEKVRKIILSEDSTASDILERIEEKGCVFSSELPYQKRLVDLAYSLLSSYKLCDKKNYKGKEVLIKPGFELGTVSLPGTGDAGYWKNKNWEVKKNFYAGTWILTSSGPEIKKFKFDIVAFDPKNTQLHVCDISKKRAGLSKLRALKRKAEAWGLPAVLHFIAPDYTGSAKKYAKRWGILLEEK